MQTSTAWRMMHNKNPTFSIFLGDFIYSGMYFYFAKYFEYSLKSVHVCLFIDVPLFMGTDVEDYNSVYRLSLTNEHAIENMKHRPTFFMFDDHEVTLICLCFFF